MLLPLDSQIRTPKLAKRHSQMSQLSELSIDIPPGSTDPYSSFIPVLLDNSPAAPLPSTSYQRPNYSDRNGSTSKPHLERNSSTSSSHYDTDRERVARPHIASQDKTYQPFPEAGGSDRVGTSQESDRERREKLGSPVDQRNKTHASPMLPRSGAPDTDLTSTLGLSGRKDDFRLGEVPRERKRSFSSVKTLEGDNTQEISISFSPTASAHNEMSPAVLAPGIMPRSDSSRSQPPRETSPSSASKKQALSSMNSASSTYSQQSNGFSVSGTTSATSDVTQTTDKMQNLQLSNNTTVTNISNTNAPSVNASPLQRLPSTRRPSTAHGSSFSPSHSDSTSENSPALPSLNSPIGNLGFDEELRRVFGGESMLKRVSNSVRHGRSFSDMARRSGQSPKWELTFPGKAGYKASLSPDINSPMGTPQEENALLKQELRRSTQKIVELEARLTVRQLYVCRLHERVLTATSKPHRQRH